VLSELDIVEVYKFIAKGIASGWDDFWNDAIDKASVKTEVEVSNLTGTTMSAQNIGKLLSNEMGGNSSTSIVLEGLNEALDYIPTAEGFFAPLEESTGNPAIYNGEEVIYTIIEDKDGNEVEKVPPDPLPQRGDIVRGNPPVFEINPDTSETLVLDIAEVVRGEDKNNYYGGHPTNITVKQFNEKTVTTTTENVSNMNIPGSENTFSGTITTTITKTTPVVHIIRLELWDRLIEYEYEEITTTTPTENGTITSTYFIALPEKITPTGKW
jgi:hypothetical protein